MKSYSTICRMMLSGAALTALLSACTFEQEDYFDESAARRIQHVNEDIKTILCAPSSENGWLIQYYVGGTDDYDFEGFNLFGKFYESGKVTLSSDHRYLRNSRAGQFTEYTSYYEMLAEEGPVLCFNTWNDILSVFVDPVNPGTAPNLLVDDGEGMNGDDRLVVLSYNSDEVLLRGERHTQPIRFVRLDRSPQEYIAATAATKAVFASGRINEFSLSNGEAERFVAGLSKGYFDYVDRLDDPLDKSVKSCVFTPTGFRTKSPLVLGNDTIQEFFLNDAKDALVSGNVVMRPCWERAVATFLSVANKPTITNEGASPSFESLYNALSNAVTEAYSTQTLTGITFGNSNESSQNRRHGLVFTMKTSSRTYMVGYEGKITVNGNQMTINVDVNNHSSNYNTYNSKDLGVYFDSIAEKMNGTYTLVPNSVFLANSVTATKTDDPNFYFVINL